VNQDDDALYFVPLGGSGEIGMNLNLYGFGPEEDREWIIVDCGVTFGDLTTPGVDVITPDHRFITERRRKLLGIVLTHAHEDHMGAVARLWRDLQCPIYATPFTAWLMRDRLAEHNLLGEAPLHEVGLHSRFELGPFDIQLVGLTHSIPEPNGVIVRTPAGLVLHTGDWKIDPDPLIGNVTDTATLEEIGKEGVMAMVCDSTNVFTEGESGSEAEVRNNLINLVGRQHGRVAIAAFASNVARLETAIRAAEANDRRVCLVGRSMHRMIRAAGAVGLLADCQSFIKEEEVRCFPPDKVLLLCTGSQGEPRAALSRIAEGAHRNVTLDTGDSIIFSSRIIPGNERGIFDLMNRLARRGVKVITERDEHVHVSGHPCRDELRQMYAWARPSTAIPVHGEYRHLQEHAALARDLKIPHVLVPYNGAVVRITREGAVIVDKAPAGRMHVDGNFLVSADAESIRERRRMAHNGHITVAAILAGENIISEIDVRTMGVASTSDYDLNDFRADLVKAAEAAFRRLDRRNPSTVEEAIRRGVRRQAYRIWGKKPHVEVIILTA